MLRGFCQTFEQRKRQSPTSFSAIAYDDSGYARTRQSVESVQALITPHKVLITIHAINNAR
jgi:hypothetical protein